MIRLNASTFLVISWISFILLPHLGSGSCCANFYLSDVPPDVLEHRCDIKIRSSEYWNRNNNWKINLRFNSSILSSIGKGWSQGSAQCIEDANSPLSYICTGEWSPEFIYSFMVIRNNATGFRLDNTTQYLQASAYEEKCENLIGKTCPEYAESKPTEDPKSSEVRIPGTGVSIKKTILIVCVSVGTACLAITVTIVMVVQRRKNAQVSNSESEWQEDYLEKIQTAESLVSQESTMATRPKSLL